MNAIQLLGGCLRSLATAVSVGSAQGRVNATSFRRQIIRTDADGLNCDKALQNHPVHAVTSAIPIVGQGHKMAGQFHAICKGGHTVARRNGSSGAMPMKKLQEWEMESFRPL